MKGLDRHQTEKLIENLIEFMSVYHKKLRVRGRAPATRKCDFEPGLMVRAHPMMPPSIRIVK